MTAGNKVEVPTPFMPSLSTGGPDPTAGCNEVAQGQTGADMGAPAGSASPGEANYGVADQQANHAFQNMSGPGSTETTFDVANADATGNNSMQNMSGANLGVPTKAMNRDPGQSLPGQHDDRNYNPMDSFE
jgi:hypothetical protein